MKNFDFRTGEVLLIHKPYTWTSFQVVNKMKYIVKSWEQRTENGERRTERGERRTENGERRAENGEWRAENGERRAENGERRTENGEWRMENGEQLPTPNSQLPTNNSRLIPPNSQLLTNNSQLPTNNSQLTTPNSLLKIGHAGTLDPLATGLLIVCTGKQTKNIEQYQAQEKEYTGTFYIGATTPCYDREKEIDAYYPTEHISDELIYTTTKQFIGKIQQTPPLFSAIKIGGKRAYKIARAGETAEIKPKEITITEFEITRIAIPEVDFRVVCGKGTYIRSLAHDFGRALNSGAHLTALCRTRIGNYQLANAITIEEFENILKYS